MTVIFVLTIPILALMYVYFLARSVVLGFASLLAVQLYSLTFSVQAALLGRLHLDPLDVVCISLMAAGVIRMAYRLRSLHGTRFLAIGYLSLFAISLVRGFFSNNFFATANESRQFVPPLLAMLYFLTAPTDEKSVRRYVDLYLLFGFALCCVAALCAAGLPVGQAVVEVTGQQLASGRFLPATGAAAILICGFLSLATYTYQRRSLLNLLLCVIFFAVAIYLRHRSVWVMFIAGFLGLILIDARLFRLVLPVALLATFAIMASIFYGGGLEYLPTESQFSDSATNVQTLEWRINGWRYLLLDEEQTPLTVMVGKPMGRGFYRIDLETGRGVDIPTHSEYLTEYLRVGVVGILIVFLFFTVPFLKLWRLNKFEPLAAYPSMSAWAIIIFINLFYGITYSLDSHAYALVGIASAIAADPRWYAAYATSEFEEESLTPA